MTQEIVNAVLASLQTNSRTVEQLTRTKTLSDDSEIEVSGGRKVTFGDLKKLVGVVTEVAVTAHKVRCPVVIHLSNDVEIPFNIPAAGTEKAGVLTARNYNRLVETIVNAENAVNWLNEYKTTNNEAVAELRKQLASYKETSDVVGYVHIRVDANGRVTDAIREDGTHEVNGNVEAAGLRLPGVETKPTDSIEGVHHITTDESGRILSYVDQEGVHIPALVKERGDASEALMVALMASADKRVMQTDAVARVTLRTPGRWTREGAMWNGQAMFTIHDDDSMDSGIPSSNTSAWMTGGGYATTLFPVLESLGLRGCISMEGWRCGLTETPPALNDNGKVVKMLQDRYGWEIQSHSMTSRYQNNNWLVESLDSDLAAEILSDAVTGTVRSNNTTSVYDRQTGKQYSVKADKSGWEETPREWIKPYVCDYSTKKELFFSPVFPVDYQWGEWFRTAAWLGIHGKAWVTCGNTSSHANVPLINAICPYGFESDGKNFYNLPPLGSTATRMMMEGQQLAGYQGEQDADNTYKQAHYDFYKGLIDEAAEKGGWIVMGLHAYRPCWVNKLPGSLVSEGGTYPDAWVRPVTDPMNPSVPDGWYPCPGTRLHMLWELLKYARDKGLLNVTSSEGFERIGNLVTVGFWNKGVQIGPDKTGIEGTREEYPHYVVGANGEDNYYSDGKI